MKAIKINQANIREIVNNETLTLVKFSAPWCVYCQRIEPAMQEIIREYEDRVTIGVVNIDDDELLMDEYGVEVVPTILLFQGGEVVDRIVVPESKAMIAEMIDHHLPKQEKEETEEKEEKKEIQAHDVIVIGGGPAGYTAALYSVRSGFDTLVLEKMSAGGQMTQTMQIDNYPGFDEGIDGITLGEKMKAGAERFGAKTKITQVHSVRLNGEIKEIVTSEGTLHAKAVIIATGAGHKHLGIAQEEQLIGKGVGYCAACDGMFFRGKTVAVVGGGNSAAADALALSRIAGKVIIIHRRDALRATKIYHEPLMQAQNIEFRWNSRVEKLLHGDKLTGVLLSDVVTGEETELALDGLFVSIGRAPATKLFEGQLELDPAGYIVADESTRTSIPGVYAVGDVRTKALRQIVTAAADGAVAAHYAEEYLMGN